MVFFAKKQLQIGYIIRILLAVPPYSVPAAEVLFFFMKFKEIIHRKFNTSMV